MNTIHSNTKEIKTIHVEFEIVPDETEFDLQARLLAKLMWSYLPHRTMEIFFSSIGIEYDNVVDKIENLSAKF
jgi:hypothetical protein